jgi:hypothetical protein
MQDLRPNNGPEPPRNLRVVDITTSYGTICLRNLPESLLPVHATVPAIEHFRMRHCNAIGIANRGVTSRSQSSDRQAMAMR